MRIEGSSSCLTQDLNIKLPENVVFFLNFPSMESGDPRNADEYFVRIREQVKNVLFQGKMSECPNLTTIDPEYVDGMAYFMSCFGIVSLEATRSGSQKSFDRCFPKFQIALPSKVKNGKLDKSNQHQDM